jgi:hypothetical protein
MHITSLGYSVIIILTIFITFLLFKIFLKKKNKTYLILASTLTIISVYLGIFGIQISIVDKTTEDTKIEVNQIYEITKDEIYYNKDNGWPISHLSSINLNNEKYENAFVVEVKSYEKNAKFLGIIDLHLTQKKMNFSIYVEDNVYTVLSSNGYYTYKNN